MAAKSETIQAVPPRLIGSLRAGFDDVATHIGLILFPVALDLFIWFGPHFSLEKLLLPLIDSFAKLPGLDAPELADMMKSFHEIWLAIAQQFNLATSLRTYPIGIPSLESGQLPQHTPMGTPITLNIQSLGGVVLLWLVFSLAGLVVGSMYFSAIARTLSTQPSGMSLSGTAWAASQSLLLTLGWIGLILVISVPGTFIVTILAMISPAIAQIGTLIIGVVIVWLLVPLLFSPHGIFMFRQNAFTSMLTSVKLVRFLLPGTGLFFLSVVILSQGLDLLWVVPPDTSWMALVAIAGHAFITTGLVAASFVYYRDATVFVRDLINHSVASRQTPVKG
jgi:hypothetical protein